MQTFLPYNSFSESARVLDSKRLGKQRVECLQIAKALLLGNSDWKNHPAVKQWAGYERALYSYSYHICWEWQTRGYKDTCLDKIGSLMQMTGILERELIYPWWNDWGKYHSNHRSILLGKDYNWYSQFHWEEKPANQEDGSWPYIWPSRFVSRPFPEEEN